MNIKRFLLTLFCFLLCSFSYVVGPKVHKVAFEKGKGGSYYFSIYMSQPAEYEINVVDRQNIIVTFKEEVVWDATMDWKDSSGRLFFASL